VTFDTLPSIPNGAFLVESDGNDTVLRYATNNPPSLTIDFRADTIRVQGETGGQQTTGRALLATLIVEDDAIGSQTLSLAGPDADSFEIEGDGLYLSAGSLLDAETKPAYQVVVQVDDPTLGSGPEDSEVYQVRIVEEGTGDDGEDSPVPGRVVEGGAEADELAGGGGDDTITGGEGDDLLEGLAGDDLLSGDAGNDTLAGGEGDDTLDGGAGADTAEYAGESGAYTIRVSAEDATVEDRGGASGGTDTLAAVETLSFLDRDVDLGVISGATGLSEEALGQLAEYYIALYNRAPDALGLTFWANAAAEGLGEREIVERFFADDEVQALFGDLSDVGGFVQTAYGNVLGREADEAGFRFWTEVVDSGAVPASHFVLELIAGAKAPASDADPEEFREQKEADAAYLADKKGLGIYFGAIKGMSDVEDAAAVMAAYDGSDESLQAAREIADSAYAQAAAGEEDLLVELVGVVEDPFAA
jgi:hypothetical protein